MSNRSLITATLVFLLLPIIAAAQGTPAGSMCGYILDPDQRPVAGAHIVVEDPNTDATRNTLTKQPDFYSIPALQPAPTISPSRPTVSPPFTRMEWYSKPTSIHALMSA